MQHCGLSEVTPKFASVMNLYLYIFWGKENKTNTKIKSMVKNIVPNILEVLCGNK